MFYKCVDKLKKQIFPKFDKDPVFNFVFASLTYHVDITKTSDTDVLRPFLPEGMKIMEGRNEAMRLYSSFYTYSDAKIEESL